MVCSLARSLLAAQSHIVLYYLGTRGWDSDSGNSNVMGEKEQQKQSLKNTQNDNVIARPRDRSRLSLSLSPSGMVRRVRRNETGRCEEIARLASRA